MKKGIVIMAVLMGLLSFSSCKPILSEKIVEDVNENSNFEIALLTPVVEIDFSSFGVIPGHGITGYYDKKYGDEEVDYDELHACYVQYDVTSYPDVVLGEKYVTGIFITDPDIYVYDYSVGDNSEEFFDFLEDKGFDKYYNTNRMVKFSKHKVEIRCGVDFEAQTINSLYVGVDLTNRLGVIF